MSSINAEASESKRISKKSRTITVSALVAHLLLTPNVVQRSGKQINYGFIDLAAEKAVFKPVEPHAYNSPSATIESAAYERQLLPTPPLMGGLSEQNVSENYEKKDYHTVDAQFALDEEKRFQTISPSLLNFRTISEQVRRYSAARV